MLLRRVLLAATALSLVAGTALAAPIVNDPNFNATATTGPWYYGITAWGADNLPPSPAYAGNPSFAGNVGFDPNNQWNNGTPGNGQAKVGFIANNGSIYQAISGFTVGTSYVIQVLTDGRVLPGNDLAVLRIGVGAQAAQTSGAAAMVPPTVVFSNAVGPVDTVGSSAKPFSAVTSSAFTATASTMTVTLSNTGASGSTVLLSGFAVVDAATVPEPASMALLGAGLLGLALARRRR